jgi:hypothetical protein
MANEEREMRSQVEDKVGPFFWGEAHQAASSNISREARLIHHLFFTWDERQSLGSRFT